MRRLLCRQYLADAAVGAGVLCGLIVSGMSFLLATVWSSAAFTAALVLSFLQVWSLQRKPSAETVRALNHAWAWQSLNALCCGLYLSLGYGRTTHAATWAYSTGDYLQSVALIGWMVGLGVSILAWPADDPRHGRERRVGWLVLLFAGVIALTTAIEILRH